MNHAYLTWIFVSSTRITWCNATDRLSHTVQTSSLSSHCYHNPSSPFLYTATDSVDTSPEPNLPSKHLQLVFVHVWVRVPETKDLIISNNNVSHHFVQCVQKVAVHLQKVLEVMSTSVYTGLNPLKQTLYRYCTSTTDQQLNTVKQQHTSTATSILTTKSTCCCLNAQRLSKLTV
jgi:hypothetical protein